MCVCVCVCLWVRVAAILSVCVCVCVRACGAGLTSMRILGRLRFFTPSAEVAAPPSGEKSDAVACWYTLARFHAGLEGVGYLR